MGLFALTKKTEPDELWMLLIQALPEQAVIEHLQLVSFTHPENTSKTPPSKMVIAGILAEHADF
jgi:hypothetical protein